MSNVTTAIADNKSISGKIDTADLAGAIGRINSPLLDLDLQNSLNMKAGTGSVSFERATTATYIDRYGVLQYADVDEPRFEKDGLLIEGASTNLTIYSSYFESYWTQTSSTRVANATTAPDGTTTATQLLESATTGEHYFRYSTAIAADENYTFSLFVKAGTRSKVSLRVNGQTGYTTCYFDIANNVKLSTTNTDTHIINDYDIYEVGNGWYRVWMNITAGSNISAYYFYSVETDGTSSTSGNGTLYVWGYQKEELPFATSYIPTTGTAVTRSSDILEVDVKGNLSNKASRGLSIHMEFDIKNTNFVYLFGGYVDGNNYFRLAVQDVTIHNTFKNNGVGSGNLYSSTGLNRGETFIFTSVFDSSGVNYYEFGNLAANTSVINEEMFNISLFNKFQLGGHREGSTSDDYRISGHIKNFKIYDKALTPTEIELLG